jgi:hypothetical protein
VSGHESRDRSSPSSFSTTIARLIGVALAGAAALGGCGGAGRKARDGIPLGAPPAAVARLCAEAARGSFAACPAVYPRRGASDQIESQVLTPKRYGGYLLSINDVSFKTADLGHVILAGQPRQFVLGGGSPGERWPQRADQKPDSRLGLPARIRGRRWLVLVEHVDVGGDAIVLRAAPYPAGGLHGGHVIVLWNAGGHGRVVSLHFGGGRYTERERIAAALAIARSERPPTPG